MKYKTRSWRIDETINDHDYVDDKESREIRGIKQNGIANAR